MFKYKKEITGNKWHHNKYCVDKSGETILPNGKVDGVTNVRRLHNSRGNVRGNNCPYTESKMYGMRNGVYLHVNIYWRYKYDSWLELW